MRLKAGLSAVLARIGITGDNIMTPEDQLSIYGKVLTGSETEAALAALARVRYLKLKLRRLLELDNLGDPQDVAADVNKSLLLGLGIVSGAITNAALVARYKAYIAAQITLYGGPVAIMDKLEANSVPLLKWVAKLNDAKVAIAAAKDADEVAAVDVETIANCIITFFSA
jgi:hypothetical protein